jgi:hypothetical protein
VSQFDDTQLDPNATVAELFDKESGTVDKRNENWFGRRFGAGNKNLAKTLVLAFAAIGIPAMAIGTLLSKRASLLRQLPILVGTPSRSVNTRSAVLAVDTFGLTIRAKNASASTIKLFEQAAVEQLARLHQTYSDWADKNLELMGSLFLKLTVDVTGTVVRVDPLASHVTNSGFTETVIADVREWKFPKGQAEPTEIMVPLLFVPKGMDPDTVVQWERKVRGPQGAAETPVAGPRVATPLRIATVSEHTSKSLPHPDHTNLTTSSALHLRKPKPEEEVLIAFKTNRPVAIRENPRFSSKNVHAVDGDTQLSILENRGDWVKVRLADAGFIGFVRKEYITPIN